jgi:hypothetical protein
MRIVASCVRMNERTYPFAIDGHLRLIVYAQVLDLMDLADALHVGSITASTEDDCDTRAWIDVRRRDEGSGSVVDERRELCGHILGTPRVQTRSMAVSEKGEKRLTCLFKLSRNIAATSRPSVLVAPKPLVQRMSSP